MEFERYTIMFSFVDPITFNKFEQLLQYSNQSSHNF